MHRIDTPTAQRDKFGHGKNGFTRGNPQTGTPATQLDYMYCDAIQEEIANVIESAGFTLDKLKHNQLSLSISELIKKGVNAGEYLPAEKVADESYETNSALNFKKRPRLNDSDMIAMTDFYLQSGNVGFEVSPTGVIRQWMLVVLNEVGESLAQEIGNITYYTKYYSIALPVSFLRAAYNAQVTVACGTMSNQGGMATLSASANITDSLSRVTVAITSYDPRVRPALYLTVIGE